MFHMNKAQETERNAIAAKLRTAYDELCASINAFNLAADEARSFAESIGRDARNAYDEKSERWQEGDAASEADEWIQSWENLDLPDAEEYDEGLVEAFESIEHNRPFRAKRAKPAPVIGEEWNPNDLVSARRDRGLPDPTTADLAAHSHGAGCTSSGCAIDCPARK